MNTGRDWKPGEDRSTAQTIPDTEPAPTLTGKSGGQWQLQPGRQPNGDDPIGNRRRRPLDEPAPTVAFGNDAAAWEWIRESDDPEWPMHRPATTIAGDARVFPPGGHTANDGRDNSKMVGRSENTIRLQPHEALVLQSFPADWPLRGSLTSQFGQVGNAVPPRLAAHLLAHLTGRTYTP